MTIAALSTAAFLAIPGLLKENLNDIFVPPEVEVSKYNINFLVQGAFLAYVSKNKLCVDTVFYIEWICKGRTNERLELYRQKNTTFHFGESFALCLVSALVCRHIPWSVTYTFHRVCFMKRQ